MDLSNRAFLQRAVLACRKAFFTAGFFSLFINILMLTTSLYMLQIYDRVITSHSYETLLYLTLIAIIALSALALLYMARSRILVKVGFWLDSTISPIALYQSADEILHNNPYGSQALKDIVSIHQFIASSSVFALFDAPWIPIYIFVIFMLHPLLGLLAVLGAILLFVTALINETMTRGLVKEANKQAVLTQRYIDTSLRNAEVIQAMGMMPDIINHWKNINKDVLNLQIKASNRSSIALSISKFLRLVLQILMLGSGAYLVIQGQITGGAMIASTILLSRALAPVEQSIGVWKQLVTARQAYQQLKQYFAQTKRQIAEITLPEPKGELTLSGVVYRVPTLESPIIFNVSLQIQPGEIIALIGPSGAGKSTLARLMVGALKPTLGDIRLDSADVYTWDRQDFGRYVGYLPQDIELFSGTVKDNIARMEEVDDEAVIAAAKQVNVHSMILKLPQGYDTPLSNYVLSGGQRQRIALARAVYKQPRLLILDEPNSNLDHDGEEALIKALLDMKEKGTTQIIISHRLPIVRHVERILVLNEGKIQFLGPRDEVLRKLKETAPKDAKR